MPDLSIGEPGAPEVEPPAGDPFVDDDLELEHEQLLDGPLEPVNEQQVRDLLDGLGRAASVPLHLGVPGLWKFSDDELDGVVPPLTRIVNRRPQLARAVHNGDQIAVALQLSAYAGRRFDLVNAARKERATYGDGEREAGSAAERGDAPAGGVAAIFGHRRSNGDRGASPLP